MGNAELDNTPRASREHGVEGLQWKTAQPAVARLRAMNESRVAGDPSPESEDKAACGAGGRYRLRRRPSVGGDPGHARYASTAWNVPIP
jgi:hypothetical protein